MFFASHTRNCTLFDDILENKFPFDPISIYFIHYHHIVLDLSLNSFIDYIIIIYYNNYSTLNNKFIDYSDLKKKQLLTNLIYQVIVQYPSYHPYLRPQNELCPLNLLYIYTVINKLSGHNDISNAIVDKYQLIL